MKRNWKREELEQHWFLFEQEAQLLKGRTGSTRLGFAVLLKFFQIEGRFPNTPREVPAEAVRYLAEQLDLSYKVWRSYPWSNRTATYHRDEIREFLGYRKHTKQDAKELVRLLTDDILNRESRTERLLSVIIEHYRQLRIEPPATEQLRRLIQSAIAEHENRFCSAIASALTPTILKRMDALLQIHPADDGDWTIWQNLKSDPGKAGIDSIKEAVIRLQTVRGIGLPADLFKGISPKLLERYAKRVAVEEPFELRRHAVPLRATLMAAFLYRRSEELTDHLVDLLIETVHKMGKKAEKRIDEGLGEALQKAPSKMIKLYRIAKASVEAPQGIVSDVIFPEAPEPWLKTLIKEVEASSGYTGKVKTDLARHLRTRC